MTLAGEPVPKSSQLWQSEAETGNKSTWMEEINFSRREFRLTLPGGDFFSRLSTSPISTSLLNAFTVRFCGLV